MLLLSSILFFAFGAIAFWGCWLVVNLLFQQEEAPSFWNNSTTIHPS
jgi:hypothetical protein